MTWVSFLIIFVMLFEVWYAAAFLYAYFQTRERFVLFPFAQALLLLAAFAYIAFAFSSGQGLNSTIVLVLLIIALFFSMTWRRNPESLQRFVSSYPRGTLDVLLFRRPAVDLKRRVRTK
jgi:hypothetical protein